MSSTATPAVPSLSEAVAAALAEPIVQAPEGGASQPAEAPVQPDQPAETVSGETAEVTATQPSQEEQPADAEAPPLEIDEFSLGLDDAETPLASPEPVPTENALSDTDQLIADLATQMTRSEAEKAMGAMLRLPKGKQMLASFKNQREVTAQLGFTPTPEEVVGFQQAHMQHSRFWDDFSSGDPQRQMQIVQEVFGVAPDGSRAQGAEQFVSTLTSALRSVNPQAYARMAAPITADLSAAMRQMASEATNDEHRARWQDAADLVDIANGRPVPGAAEETATERELRGRLEQQSRMIQNERARQAESAMRTAQGAYYQRAGASAGADIDRALECLKGKVDDVTYSSYRTDLSNKLRAYWDSYHSNPAVRQRIEAAFKNAASTRSRSPLEAEVARLRRAYEPKLAEWRIDYIKAAGARAQSVAQATADKLRQAQNKTEPTQASHATAAAASSPIPARMEGESLADYKSRTIRQLVGGA